MLRASEPISESRAESGTWLGWASVLVALLLAALLWSGDTDALLRSLTPAPAAWTALAILWIEIGALIFAFVRRYQLKRRGLRLCAGIAWSCAGVNLLLTIPLLPALVFVG